MAYTSPLQSQSTSSSSFTEPLKDIHYFPFATAATVGSSPSPVYLSSDQVQQLIAYLSKHLQQQTINPLESPLTLEPSLPNGHVVAINRVGSVRLFYTLNLDNILFVPMFTFNLLSISALTLSHNCSVNFLSNSCVI